MTEKTGSGLSLHAMAVGALFALIGLVGVYYGFGHWRAPELASSHGAGVDSMMVYLLICTGAMFLAGHLLLGYMILVNRRNDRVSLRMATPKTERMFSVVLGFVMALAAEGGVVVIGVPVWDEYYGAEIPDNAVTVEVLAQQFVWNFRYPGPDGVFGRTDPSFYDDVTNPMGIDRSDPASADDIVSINNLYLPGEETVHLVIKSRDVIHSFFLPHFRVKQDAVPGMSIDVKFTATRTGDFEIACTELCGMAHYRMQAFLHVLPRGEFDGWLAQQGS
ncbi:MAG: cytochrome-c oxidase [Acidobacteriota bacterium]|jgi:cytochrome c oxidase subunit 2